MVLGYLAVCPTQGRHTARVLLTRRQIHSDQEAVLTAQSLQALNWVADSRRVLLARANYWLQKTHPLFRDEAYCQSLNVLPKDVVTDALRSNRVVTGQTSSSSSSSSRPELTYSLVVSKAVYFLKMAKDVTFIDDLIDRSLYRLMSAVAVCKPLFKGVFVSSTLCLLWLMMVLTCRSVAPADGSRAPRRRHLPVSTRGEQEGGGRRTDFRRRFVITTTIAWCAI